MAKFIPRTTAPTEYDYNQIQVAYQYGRNHCILINSSTGSVLPNCTGYVHFRWLELAYQLWGLEAAKKLESRLCLNNAEIYWNYTQDGFARGQEPKLGSIIVWRKGPTYSQSDGAGHVAVVEEVNRDSSGNVVSIRTSASNYCGTRYYNSTYKKSNNWYIGSSYTALGFIYFPFDFESQTYTNSELVDYIKISPNKTKDRKYPITKITIHHMAGNLTVEQCGEIFQGSRKASSNYGIGTDGRVGLYVDEKDRSWCSSNADNDNRAITIEVANDGGEPDWHVSDTAYSKLIDLCVDICKRNGIERLNYTGDTSGNLTMHCWFAATACPGPYLKSKFPDIAMEVNERLGMSDYIGTPVARNKSVDQVEVTINNLNGRLYPSISKSKWNKYITPGYYNIYDTEDADGYTWYEIQLNLNGIGDNLWGADVGMTFLPKEGDVDWKTKYEELELKYEKLESEVAALIEANKKLNDKVDTLTDIIKQVNELTSI